MHLRLDEAIVARSAYRNGRGGAEFANSQPVSVATCLNHSIIGSSRGVEVFLAITHLHAFASAGGRSRLPAPVDEDDFSQDESRASRRTQKGREFEVMC